MGEIEKGYIDSHVDPLPAMTQHVGKARETRDEPDS
jgi:hypothetical protein